MENRFSYEKLHKHLAMVLSAVCFVLISVLFIISIFRTSVYAENQFLGEYVLFELDSGFFNIILLTVMVCSSYLVYRFCERVNLKLLNFLMLVWTVLIGVLFVYSASRAPEGDAEIIANTAFLAANGNYNAMADYFARYPFSMGLAFYEELVFRFLRIGFPEISKGYCFMALEMLNVVLLAFAFFAMVRLSGALYKSESVQKQNSLFLILFVPAVFACTSISGRVPAMCFAIIGIWLFAVYIKEKKLLSILASALCAGSAMAIKLDAVIVFSVILFVWLLRIISRENSRECLAFAVFLLLSVAVAVLPILANQYRMETIAGENDRTSVREAMGFDEKETGTLIYSGMYSAVSSEISGSGAAQHEFEMQSTSDSFFQQWNEPEFHTIISNRNSRHYRETGDFYSFVCNPDGKLLPVFLNLYQSFILAGAAIAMLKVFKERSMIKLLPALVFLGGVIMHLLFPAQSSHAMKYYLLLLPLTAYGYSSFFEHFWLKQDKQ